MGVVMGNPLYINTRDQYEIDAIALDTRADDYHRLARGTMRKLRLTSNVTEQGARARREWRQLVEEMLDAERYAAAQGRSLDDEPGALAINAMALAAIAGIAAWLLLGALVMHWPQIHAVLMGWGWAR